MGSFNIGDLYATMRLDDAEFEAKVRSLGAASALLATKFDATTENVTALGVALERAGFSAKSIQTLMESLVTTDETYNDVSKRLSVTLQELQLRIAGVSTSLSVESRALAASVANSKQLTAAHKLITEAIDAQRIKAIESNTVQLAATEREAASAADYAGLRARFNAQELADRRELYRATEVGTMQEIEYTATANEAKALSDANYTGLKTQLENQVLAAQEKARLEALASEEKYQAARVDIEAEADRRRLAIFTETQEAQFSEFVSVQKRQEAAAGVATGSEGAGRFGVRVGSNGPSPRGFIGGGVGIAAAAIGFLGYESVKQALTLEDALIKVQIQTHATANELESMRSAALSMAQEAGVDVIKVVDLFTLMSKSGMSVESMLKQLPQLVKNAVGQSLELVPATSSVLKAMISLQVPAEQTSQFLDFLTYATHNSAASQEQLADALSGKSGAALRAYNVSLRDSVALATVFAQKGIEGGEAQTAITQTLTRMIQSVKTHGDVTLDVAGKTRSWRDITTDQNGNLRTLETILQTLDTAFKGQPSGKIIAFFNAIGTSSERATYVKALLNTSEALINVQHGLDAASGASSREFDTRMQGHLSHINQLWTAAKELTTVIGTELVAAFDKWFTLYSKSLPQVSSPQQDFPHTTPQHPTAKTLIGNAMTFVDKLKTPVVSSSGDVDDPQADAKAAKKAETLALAMDRAQQAVARFKQEAHNGVKTFSNAIIDQVQAMINGLDTLATSGASPARIENMVAHDRIILKDLEDQGKAAKKTAKEYEEWNLIVEEGTRLAAKLDETQAAALEKSSRNQKSLFGNSGSLLGPAANPLDGIQPWMKAMLALGIQVDQFGEASKKVFTEFQQAASGTTSLEALELAWGQVSRAIQRTSSEDLPLAMRATQGYINGLTRLNGPLGQVYAAQAQLLQQQIRLGESYGKLTNAEVVGLFNVQQKQQLLIESSHVLGTTLTHIAGTLNGVFTGFAHSLASGAVNGKGFYNSWHSAIKSIEQDILQSIIQGALQPLKKALSGVLSSIIGGIFGSGAGPGAGLPGESGGAFSFLSLIGGIIPHFATGTDYVPRDMVAMVHAGERITPAYQNGLMSGMAGGSGSVGDMHVHIGSIHPEVSQYQVNTLMDRVIRSGRRVGYKG